MKKVLKYQSQRGLDYTNFFMADVRDGIGPFLGIYLLSTHNWNVKDIGIVTSIAGFAGVIAQTPAGTLVDKIKNKKTILIIASLLIGLGTVINLIKPNMFFVTLSQIIVGVSATIVGPALAGITLGLVGYKKLEQRTGRNEMFNHSGNVVSALISGLIGYYIGLQGIFIYTLILSLAGVASLQLINNKEINYNLSRGSIAKDDSKLTTSRKKVLLQPLLLIFILCCVLFHFANAAMLPMAGQYIVSVNKVDASIYMAACIVMAQLIMVPVAAYCGKKSTSGRKWLMIICFAILPLRGFLFTLSAAPFYVTAVQVLDGISAGIFGVVNILIIADLTKGSGHFNFINGIVITAVGIGAACSNVVAGYIANAFSFQTAFLFLAAVAAVALLIYIFFMKETYLPQREVYKPDT
jgi:MFS family permease